MKTYQLLRNNQSMGYYTATCLLQIGLQPLDLLWVDGESVTWKYPSELEEFRAHVSRAPFNEATRVNDLKEQQILYFDAHIAEMDYKKLNIALIEQPDTRVYDMTPGFEYMIRAQKMRLNKSNHKNIAGISEEQRAVEAVRSILDKSESVLGSDKMINAPERNADPHHFTTVWEARSETREKAKAGETGSGKRASFRTPLSAAITGLIALASSAIINFRF